ncbi:MAG TPA: hypothetical protein DCX95_02340 [Elusimicrobia bacterium]|nr:hypothetical protein [Elusimicrobiota bacterium]
MKIFHISNSTNYSGGVAQMLMLSDALAVKNGYDDTAVCQKESEIYERTRSKKIAVEMNSQIAAAYKLAKIIKSEKPDIVHCHHPKAHNIVLLSSFLSKIPNIVVTRRVSFPISKNPVQIYKYKTKKNKKIIAVSEKIKQNMVDIGVEPERVPVIYSGTDFGRFNPSVDGSKIRKELNIPQDAFVIGKIANYSFWKGYGFFLDACRIISEKISGCHFIIAGQNTDSAEIKRELLKRNICDKTSAMGFRNDIPELIAAFDISVNASTGGEGISGAIRESMGMEKPVIATDVGGNAEIVKNEKNGILIEPGNAQTLAEAIISFYKNSEKRKELGKNGRKTVLENFSVDAMVSKHEKIYEELMNGKS